MVYLMEARYEVSFQVNVRTEVIRTLVLRSDPPDKRFVPIQSSVYAISPDELHDVVEVLWYAQ